MQGPQKPIELFCSYAHEDEAHLQKLETHLSILKRQGLISTWHDRQITAGTEWAQAIDTHLNSASVILLLISPDFFASDYCYGLEMTRALERHKANEARVIPILLRHVDWKGAPFAHLQALPTNAKPVTSWSNRDEAWASVAVGIRRVIEDLGQSSANPSRREKLVSEPQDARKYYVENKGSVQGLVIGDRNTVHQHFHDNTKEDQKNGIRSLEKGSKALWGGDYPSAKKELRVAIEEIDGEGQPREASKARYFYALALLDGKLPRTQGRTVMQSIQELMNNAIRLHPCASYYRIFARIKKNFFEHNGLDHRLNEVSTLEHKGASLLRCADDEENEEYLRHCQPCLQI